MWLRGVGNTAFHQTEMFSRAVGGEVRKKRIKLQTHKKNKKLIQQVSGRRTGWKDWEINRSTRRLNS